MKQSQVLHWPVTYASTLCLVSQWNSCQTQRKLQSFHLKIKIFSNEWVRLWWIMILDQNIIIPILSRPQSLLVRHARHCSQCWRRSRKRGCCKGSWLARTYQNLFSPTVKESYRMLKNFCLLSEAAGPKGFARKSKVSPQVPFKIDESTPTKM